MASLRLLVVLGCFLAVNGQARVARTARGMRRMADMDMKMMMPMPDADGVYRLEACEGMDMNLMCPESMEITILDGFFGRDNNVTCDVQGRTSSNTNCIVPKDRVLEKLRMGCQGKMKCMVPATIETFTSPCSMDVSKYARVAYVCTPTMHKIEMCSLMEESRVQMCCPDHKMIMIQNAFYGRDDTHSVCRNDYNRARNRTDCRGVNSLGVIQELCDGEMSCELDVSILGEPCGTANNYKYLAVNYTCQECKNDLGDDALCETWANQGFCYNNSGYMYSQCRKACLRCGEEMPPEDSTVAECVNVLDDVQCEEWAAIGECNANPAYMVAYCRKTCMACGLRTDCIDRNSNCPTWADEGQCTTNPGYMLPMCRKSCYQCDSIVPCMDNPDYAADCPQWARDGECDNNPGFMIPLCTKSCLNCTKSPMCTNKHENEFSCLNWANNDGQCTENAVWMHQNCWADCVGCLREPVCVNYRGNDAECDWLWYTGRAYEDPYDMMFNCLKSVTRCRPKDYVAPNVCRDRFSQAQCEEYADQGECLNNAIWMMRNCRATCTKCNEEPKSERVGGCMRSGEPYNAEYATNVLLPYEFKREGALKQFSGFFVTNQRIRIGIWRKNGPSYYSARSWDFTPKGDNTLEVIPVNGCFNVRPDDRIGFTMTAYADYPFAYGPSKTWMGDDQKIFVRPTTSGNFVGVPVQGTFAVDAIIAMERC